MLMFLIWKRLELKFNTPNCMDLDCEGVVWVCADSHIECVLRRFRPCK
jgi:hypothetical protein